MKIAAIVIYIIILVFFAMPASAIVYHLTKFGIKKDFCKLIISIFVTGSVILLAISLFLVLTIDFNDIFRSMPIDIQGFEINP